MSTHGKIKPREAQKELKVENDNIFWNTLNESGIK